MDTLKAGYVYVLQMEGHPYFKIGRTTKIGRRVGQISTLLPTQHRLICYYSVLDAPRAEKILHDEFSHVRMNGEWFQLRPIDIQYIHANCLLGQAYKLSMAVSTALSRRTDVSLNLRTERLVKAYARTGKRMERRWSALARIAQKRWAEPLATNTLEVGAIG